ncbi:Uncharacterised protein [uncultured archaeon]|nr:Uncharacterised protein [uncultured archaeon]
MPMPMSPIPKVIQVLHKIEPAPGSNVISFTPAAAFRCSHILVWFREMLFINQISIGPIEQLVPPGIPGPFLKSPVELAVIEEWFKLGILSTMLTARHIWPIDMATATPMKAMKIEFEGEFDLIVLYGVQAKEEPCGPESVQ